jgi:2-keto-3-deoxy-6-phosphogluconate aldolase
MGSYLKLSNVIATGSSTIISNDLIENQHWDELTKRLDSIKNTNE